MSNQALGVAMLLLMTEVIIILLGRMVGYLVELKMNGLSIFTFVLLLLLSAINVAVYHSLRPPTGEILYASAQIAVLLIIVGFALDHSMKLKNVGEVAKVIGAVILAIVLISMFFLFLVPTF